MTDPSELVIDGVEHTSVAVAAPGSGTPVGLHPRLLPGGQKVNVGGVLSETQVKVWAQVDVFPQASIAV